MNLALRTAVLAVMPRPGFGAGILRSTCKLTPSAGCTSVFVPNCNISVYERPYRYAMRIRRLKEKFKNPERFSKPSPRYTYTDWNYKSEIYAFGKRLGEDFDDALLREALTDQSYIHKEKVKQEELGIDTAVLELKNNVELAEIGFQLTENTLFRFVRKEVPLFPAEGHSALVKHLMSAETLANIASNLGMKDIILCEEYPPSNTTYSRSFLAVIGALSQTSREARAEKFVIDLIASLLCGKDLNEIWDIPRPWQMMVQLAKQRGVDPVEPRLVHEAGRNTIHAAFVVGVYDKNKNLLGKGIGETLDIAQEMAARDVLQGFFSTREPKSPFEFQSANIPYRLIPHVRNINK